MQLVLSTMYLTLHSASISALLETMSVISFSTILATLLASNPVKTSLPVQIVPHQSESKEERNQKKKTLIGIPFVTMKGN